MKTIHPAIIITQGFYDETRDLEQHEQRLLIDVSMARHDRARSIGYAVKNFGDLTPAYHATVFLADRAHDETLDKALAKYQAAQDLEYAGEMDLVEYHMSEAAE
jgi:hypothetical protein